MEKCEYVKKRLCLEGTSSVVKVLNLLNVR